MFDNLPPELAAAFKPIVESMMARLDAIEQRFETTEKGIVNRLDGATLTLKLPPDASET